MVGLSLFILMFLLLDASAFAQSTNAPTSDQTEFFEQHIRPVLAERCYKCHNSHDLDEAGLAVDFRDGIRGETEHGQVVIPGNVESSLLLKVIRHEIDDLEMPEDSGKLPDEVISRFEEWIEMGAPDPRDAPPSEEELKVATSWETTLNTRKQWWSFQPLTSPKPPKSESELERHPIDRFILPKLKAANLSNSPQADRRTLIRRLTFVLTGLPPTPKQVDRFVNDQRDDAYQRLVDELLASERFGERWARHWMDLMRYADSHGSEGDPAIPEIYRYRDYLIRAFNQDVPYDQLLREHVAGDLLDEPRINHDLEINESAIGPAHWRLVFHGFAPTDALDEKVRFIDDQINVFSKAFLGMTVSCARCHNHKFDAISQADYYALFGILASCRPSLRDVNTDVKQQRNVQAIATVKDEIKLAVVHDWNHALSDIKKKLLSEPWLEKARSHKNPNQLLFLLGEVTRHQETGKPISETWDRLTSRWQDLHQELSDDAETENAWRWNLADPDDYDAWYGDGNGLPDGPQPAGDFRIDSAEQVVAAILPAGVNANTISKKHRAFLGSPRFQLDDEYNVWLRINGEGQPSVRYAVENYPRNGTVYPIRTINNKRWSWQKFSLKYWKGDFVHLELNTARDAPLQVRGNTESWFGLREVIVRRSDQPEPKNYDQEFAEPLFALGKSPTTKSDVAEIYLEAITAAIDAWRENELSDAQAVLLNECILEGLLPTGLANLPSAKEAFGKWKALSSRVSVPTRVPGLQEADIFDQPLFARGNHRQPKAEIPRRFLEALDPAPFETSESGRRELAERLTDPENPLVSRVMVNRIWHYVFGQGIVPTTDNFGQLGQKPSHAELLDYLASRFLENGWSIKQTIRFLVTSQTFQRTSLPSARAQELDPQNRLLSHANVRRLDAESIRDSLMAVSGQMDYSMYGPGFNPNGSTPRRAIYVRSRRNSLDRFLEAFNSPVPFATTGRRNQTNVPAQSLMMLNDPFVLQVARSWAQSELTQDAESPLQRISRMFERAFVRKPTKTESDALLTYLNQLEEQTKEIGQRNSCLTTKIQDAEKRLETILAPVRESLAEEKSLGEFANLAPTTAWDFENGLADLQGRLRGKIHGKVKLEAGAIVLDGGFVSTSPLDVDLAEKTLVATVQLATLNQKGGGAITVQTLNGEVFDSIVFAERQDRRWMPGSDGFRRTDDFGAPMEGDASKQPVHLAIAYDNDGTIRGYRNGKAYGKSIRKADLQTYKRKQFQVVFGLRHGTSADGGRILRGRIFDAQIFDRALSSDEIAALATGQAFISDAEVLSMLSEADWKEVDTLREQLAQFKTQKEELGYPLGESERWARIAHAIFNLKEFIYIK